MMETKEYIDIVGREGIAYDMGFNDGVKAAEEELYESFLDTLSDILAEGLDIHVAIKEIRNEIAKRM